MEKKIESKDRRKTKSNEDRLMKWLLLIQSMSPLFLLLAIRSYPKSNVSVDAKILFFMCCVWLVVAMLAYILLYMRKKIDFNGIYDITSVKNVSKEGLEFVVALILPLSMQMPENSYDLMFFVVLLVMIIILLSKTKRWAVNPVLLVLGYKVYKIKFLENNNFCDDVYAITKQQRSIIAGQAIDYVTIDQGSQIIFVRRSK